MPKRLVDTELWRQGWFRRLDPVLKCFTRYLFENCDCAGFWEIDLERAAFEIGVGIDLELFLEKANSEKQRFEVSPDRVFLFVCDFIPFHYGLRLEKLERTTNVRVAVIERCKHRGWPEITQQLPNSCSTLDVPLVKGTKTKTKTKTKKETKTQDKEEDKDKDLAREETPAKQLENPAEPSEAEKIRNRWNVLRKEKYKLGPDDSKAATLRNIEARHREGHPWEVLALCIERYFQLCQANSTDGLYLKKISNFFGDSKRGSPIFENFLDATWVEPTPAKPINREAAYAADRAMLKAAHSPTDEEEPDEPMGEPSPDLKRFLKNIGAPQP
ncbi:MAG: hypothetical protein ABIH23_08420 [bacterium]